MLVLELHLGGKAKKGLGGMYVQPERNACSTLQMRKKKHFFGSFHLPFSAPSLDNVACVMKGELSVLRPALRLGLIMARVGLSRNSPLPFVLVLAHPKATSTLGLLVSAIEASL